MEAVVKSQVGGLTPMDSVPDAAVLHSLAQMFGLLDCVKRALQNRRSQAGQNQELLHSTLVGELPGLSGATHTQHRGLGILTLTASL